MPAVLLQEPPEDMDVTDGTPYATVTYELRVYSLCRHSFGRLLASAPAKAPHCITSVQFSPSGGFVLVAYGRFDDAMLCNIFTPTGPTLQAHAMLEVYQTDSLARKYVRHPQQLYLGCKDVLLELVSPPTVTVP